MESNNKHTCPSCGYKVFKETPGSDEICPICFWHDDLIDLETMYEPVGPNKVSLEQAQKNYIEFCAKERRLINNVCRINNFEKDKNWRLLNRAKDTPKNIDSEAKEHKDLYYWYWN